MISREELERGIRATEARLAEARKDPLVIRELEEARAEQMAYQIMESLMSTARFRRKMDAYREIFDRDFGISVTLGERRVKRTRRPSRRPVHA